MRVWLLALVFATAVPAASAVAAAPDGDRTARRTCVAQVRGEEDERPRERSRLRSRAARPEAAQTQTQPQAQPQSCPAESPAAGRRYLPHYFL